MRREPCDTVLYNGKIVTVDEDFSIAEAVAISGGKFLKVGGDAEVRALSGPGTREVDLKGKTVVPGFIDTHPHMIHHAIGRVSSLPLIGLRSIEAVKKRIAEKVEKTPSGGWIATSPLGEPPDYFDLPDDFEEKRWPTRWDLDEVSPNNPVYIPTPTAWPHPTILNSLGLKILGITRDTPSEPQGIEVIKDPQTGEPNGQLNGMHLWTMSPFFWKLMAMLPRPAFGEMIDGLKAHIRDYNAVGITTAYECHALFAWHLLLCKELWSRNELTLRVYFTYEVDTRKSLEEIDSWMNDLAHATGSGFGDDRLRLGGVTVSIDGPVPFGSALMNKPYLDAHGKPAIGVQEVSTEKFKEIALLAAKHNLRVNSCIGGDKSADITLEVFEGVNREIPIKDRRWVIQHIQFPSRENIEKCKELGVVITTMSNTDYGWAEIYAEKLGGDYWARSVPLRRWLDAGILTAQSTDGGHYQPMFTLWQSLKRVDRRTGKSVMSPDKKITREEALRLYTINGARILFWEDKLGSIEAGKLADLVVLDKDILTCPVDDIRDSKVLMTMVGGEVVYEGS